MVNFPVEEVRPMGRTASGVIGIDLDDGVEAVGVCAEYEGELVLVVTDKGYGKMTHFSEYRITKRGAKGDKGDKGDKGEKGETGDVGASVLTGEGVPASTLGRVNDSYIDLLTWNYYLKTTDGWVLKGNLKGGTGDTGNNGKSAYEIYKEAHPEYTKR